MNISLMANTTIPNLNQSLIKQIDTITEQILEQKNEVKGIGLLGGKAGITLLFAYLSKTLPIHKDSFGEKNYLQSTLDCLDGLSDSLSNEELNYNMSGGVAGIAFVFQHLRNIGILDKNDDLNLSELD